MDEPYDEVIEATLTTDGDQTTLVIETRGMPSNLIALSASGRAHSADESTTRPCNV